MFVAPRECGFLPAVRSMRSSADGTDARIAAITSDNALTFARRSHDTSILEPGKSKFMLTPAASLHRLFRHAIPTALAFWIASMAAAALDFEGRNVPLLSGCVGFVTSTNDGSTTYLPVISSLRAAPIGSRIPVEGHAIPFDSFFPRGGEQPGYRSNFFLGLTYLQADILASRHFTIVAEEFPSPFATYNECLSPTWIGNFESAPLIFSEGTMGSASSIVGMLRGSAFSTAHASADYVVYCSANGTNRQFNAERGSGAPYGRLLQGTAKVDHRCDFAGGAREE